MTKISFAVLVVMGVCLLGGPRAIAQDAPSQADNRADVLPEQQMALLRKDIRSTKKQLVSANLTLTDSEATKFWPLYEQYSADYEKINDTRTAIIKEYADGYGTLTEDRQTRAARKDLA